MDPGQDIAILRFFADLLSHSKQIPGEHLKYSAITFFHIFSYSSYTILPSAILIASYYKSQKQPKLKRENT